MGLQYGFPADLPILLLCSSRPFERPAGGGTSINCQPSTFLSPTGGDDPLHSRVIALSDGVATALVVSTETGRGPYGPQFAQAIADHAGLPLEAVFYTATHSHAAPGVTRAIDLDFAAGDSGVTANQRWAKLVMDSVLSATDEALSNLEPVAVGIGYSESYINVNWSVHYTTTNPDGTQTVSHNLGYNGAGISDKTLAAIQFTSIATGDPVAFLVNDSVHGTVMHGNTRGPVIPGVTSDAGGVAISSDIPGLASSMLEDKYVGSVAVWLSGAAADQAPIVQNEMMSPDPQTGAFNETLGDDYNLLLFLSRIHVADIERALANVQGATGDAPVTVGYADSSIPALDGSDYYVGLQSLRIGDILLLGFAGEMYTQTGLDIKAASPVADTLVVNHTWQRAEQHEGYHPDDQSIAEGSWQRSTYEAGHLSPTLAKLAVELAGYDPAWSSNGDGTSSNADTGQTVIDGLDGIPGMADDNRIVGASGNTLKENVTIVQNADRQRFVQLGNGFACYAGEDGLLGTRDDLVRSFGSFPQHDTTGATKDPIDWRLLDIKAGNAVLVAGSIMDAVAFNNDGDDNRWSTSNLRAWLNSTGGIDTGGITEGFYDAAFGDAEKAKIVPTQVNMGATTEFWAYNRLPGADGALGTRDDIVQGFGSFPQSDATGATSDPLTWRVVEIRDGNVVLVSEKVLDAAVFNSAGDDNRWSTSNLRAWLNSTGGTDVAGIVEGFYDKAFTAEEKAKIVPTRVNMHSTGQFVAYNRLLSSDWWNAYATTGDEDTSDNVFALSGEEIFSYFGTSQIATRLEVGHEPTNYTNNYVIPTESAKTAAGVKINTGGNGPSFAGYADAWTRSPGAPTDGTNHYGVFLGSTGSLNSGPQVTSAYGVLPAITVKVPASSTAPDRTSPAPDKTPGGGQESPPVLTTPPASPPSGEPTQPPGTNPAAAATAIKGAQKRLTLVKGQTAKVPTHGYTSEGKVVTVIWTSNEKAVAKVGATTGRIKALKVGTAKVTARAGSLTWTIAVKVLAKKPAAKVTKVTAEAPAEAAVGTSFSVSASYESARAARVVVTYASSNPAVLRIDKAGRATAIKAGTAKITVKAGAKKKTLTVAVK